MSMKISIITPVLNGAEFIEETIQSVLAQDVPDLEYWVIDGGSTDGTLDILRRYESHLRWLSEADSGLSNAINKGFRLASGEILGWLNADDFFIGQPLSASLAAFEQQPQIDLIYGQAVYVDAAGRPTGTFGEPFHFINTLSYRVSIPQQGALWRRELWEKVGGLREDLRYTMDIAFWLSALEQNATLHFMPGIRAVFRIHENAFNTAQAVPTFLEHRQIAEDMLASKPALASQARRIRLNLNLCQAYLHDRRGERAQALQHYRAALRYADLSQRTLYGLWRWLRCAFS